MVGITISCVYRKTNLMTFTPYRFDDMLNNIKSVSAQTGTIDKFDALKNITRRVFRKEPYLILCSD